MIPSVFQYVAPTHLFIRQMSSAKFKSESSVSILAMPISILAACHMTESKDLFTTITGNKSNVFIADLHNEIEFYTVDFLKKK